MFKPKKKIRQKRSNYLVKIIVLIIFSYGLGYSLDGTVTHVSDGDTFHFIDGFGTTKVRVYGIDAPELEQSGGQEAYEFAKKNLLFKKVRISPIDKDRYGRMVALVYFENGTTYNEEVVKSGHAWVYNAYCKLPLCAYWLTLQEKARLEKKGLWKNKSPVAPWNWRKRRR